MAAARLKLPVGFGGLLRSELEAIINETIMSKEDRYIANQYFLEEVPQIDIAAELNLSRNAVTCRINKIREKLTLTKSRLFKEY